MRTDILERRNEILQWIEEEQPKSYICQQLGCKQETLNSYLKKMDKLKNSEKCCILIMPDSKPKKVR